MIWQAKSQRTRTDWAHRIPGIGHNVAGYRGVVLWFLVAVDALLLAGKE
jgi:hypothetical protein